MLSASDVDRIYIRHDENWETSFIPWLEDKETRNVGSENGVFVATVDSSIRILQPQTEEQFVKQCMQEKLSVVTSQQLRQFGSAGLYRFGSVEKSKSSSEYKTFMENASKLHHYKNDTCCSQVLRQKNGLEGLFQHIDFDVIQKKVEKVQCNSNIGFGNTKSRVLLEESADKLRLLHKKYSENAAGFMWERRQRRPPEDCPDRECVHLKSDEECASNIKKHEKAKSYPRDGENAMEMCYGYGFETPDETLKITQKLCLGRIFNILWLLPNHYPGFHSCYLYYGTTHTFFPVHVEDALTWSLNYLYLGHPKVWVIIPPVATELLDFHLSKGGFPLNESKCRNLLGHKIILLTISWLRDRQIPFKIVVQHPGDLVVLYPSAAHFGFNTGPNVAQAVNIGTISWIPWGINAKKCTCLLSAIHLDMTPLVAAFRKDLLKHLLNGDVVVTPQMLQGMQLLHNEVSRSCLVDEQSKSHEEEVPTFTCPAKVCGHTFSQTPVQTRKMAMIRHVSSVHKPILESSQLLKKIKNLFEAYEGK